MKQFSLAIWKFTFSMPTNVSDAESEAALKKLERLEVRVTDMIEAELQNIDTRLTVESVS